MECTDDKVKKCLSWITYTKMPSYKKCANHVRT